MHPVISNRRAILLIILLLLVYAPLAAQERSPDPVKKNTFPPELIIEHQKKIGLTADQQKAIKDEVRGAQAKFTDLQWDLKREMESFVALLEEDQVDEAKTMDALKKMLDLESRIKQTHLGLLIRIKNILTPEQKQTLRQIMQRR